MYPELFGNMKMYPLLFFSTENVPSTIFQYRYVLTVVCEKISDEQKKVISYFFCKFVKNVLPTF